MGAEKHIHNVALNIMGRLKLEEARGNVSARNLYELFGEAVRKILRKMRIETLGRIAAQGRGFTMNDRDNSVGPGTNLYDVHCESWLDKYASGKSLLLEIATTAIIAEIADILALRKEYEGYLS